MATAMRDGLANVRNMVGKGKVLARNTWRFETADNVVHIRLHATDVVQFLPRGKVKLDSGGWKTVTTKDRINSFSPYSVYSNKGVWMVHPDSEGRAKGFNPVPFVDGMILPDAFKASPKKQEALIARQVKMKARIKAIVAKAIQVGKPVPKPNGGDCWLCMGMMSGLDASHIAEHIREGYIHGTLIRNAYHASGRTDFALSYDIQDIESDRGGRNSGLNQMRRIVRTYLQKQMGLTA